MVIREDRRLHSRKHISRFRRGARKSKIGKTHSTARYRKTKSGLSCAMKSNVTIGRLQALRSRRAWCYRLTSQSSKMRAIKAFTTDWIVWRSGGAKELESAKIF